MSTVSRSSIRFTGDRFRIFRCKFSDQFLVASPKLSNSWEQRCLGCCTKTPFVTTDNKPTGNLGKGPVTNRHSILEDFCSSSTYEMDYSLPQSQISASSTSVAAADAQCSSGNNPSEFVNRGLLLWNQTRQQWIGDKAPDHNKKPRPPVISWNATYDNLLGTNKPFRGPSLYQKW